MIDEPINIQELAAQDRLKREQEFVQRFNQLCAELRVTVRATISAHGNAAIAKIEIKAE